MLLLATIDAYGQFPLLRGRLLGRTLAPLDGARPLVHIARDRRPQIVVARDAEDGHALRGAVTHVVAPAPPRALQQLLALQVVAVGHGRVRTFVHLPVGALHLDHAVVRNEPVGRPREPRQLRVRVQPCRRNGRARVPLVRRDGLVLRRDAVARGAVALKLIHPDGSFVRRLTAHPLHLPQRRADIRRGQLVQPRGVPGGRPLHPLLSLRLLLL